MTLKLDPTRAKVKPMPKSTGKRKTTIEVRETTRADVPDLVALNKLAYPDLVEENIIWKEEQLWSHLQVFPQGQLVALIRGRIVGAVASLMVDLGADPLRLHTFEGITDGGYFTNHDPRADTLYGADVYVHPKAQGKGVGAALYEARRKLCRELNLRRIVAGGRLFNYEEYQERVSPEEYVGRVVEGDIHDQVLSFQLREGFEIRGVLPNYLPDPVSSDNAAFLEWLNPDFHPVKKGQRKVRITSVQYQMRKVKSFDDFARQVTYFVDVASDYRSDFVLFPEFFSVQLLSQSEALTPQEGIRELAKMAPQFRELMRGLAVRFGMTIIAGSHPVQEGKHIYNTSFICLPDGEVVSQRKLHITPNERKWWRISGGDTLRVVETPKAKIGVLICYDVEFPEAARHLADSGMEILFVPFCTDNRQGYLRVRYCAQARAIENQIYVAMTGNVGNLPDVSNMDIQYAQAAVLTPSDFAFARDAIAAEADSSEETLLVCDVDLDDLYDCRSAGTVTPRLDRRKDLFHFVCRAPEAE
jgi:predicted amidohydrolase/GNAT superfamily N-acetyltransferase